MVSFALSAGSESIASFELAQHKCCANACDFGAPKKIGLYLFACVAYHLKNPEEMAIEKRCLGTPLKILYLPLSSVIIGGYIFLLRIELWFSFS
jgi:hypothetical protein